MNTPLIITEMNKPGSIIISSSAPSLPRCPPLPPQPYFCLFIHATGWAGWGRAGGAQGGRGVSTVWQHGPGNGVRWAPGRPPVCLCAHGRESTCRFSTCVNACLCPGVQTHLCVCGRLGAARGRVPCCPDARCCLCRSACRCGRARGRAGLAAEGDGGRLRCLAENTCTSPAVPVLV